MPEFSDLVRQRLAIAAPVDDHPDADTLTAYAEKLLPVAERGRVLDHLAACCQCRDVISLSLEAKPVPELVPAVATASPAARRRWKPWYGLATASSIAALAAVTVLIVNQPRTGQLPAPRPAVQSAPTQSNDETARVAEPATTPSGPIAGLVSPGSGTPLPAASGISEPPVHLPSLSAKQSSSAKQTSRSAEVASNSERVQQEPPVVLSSNTSTVDAIAASVTAPSGRRRDYVNDNLFVAGQSQNVPTVNEIPSSTGGASAQLANGGFINGNQISSFADVPPQISNTRTLQSWNFQASPSHRLPTIVSDLKRGVTELLHKRSPALIAGGIAPNTMGGPGQFNTSIDRSQNVEITAAPPQFDTGGNELAQSSSFTHKAMSGTAMASLDTRPQTAWQVGNGNLYRTSETGAWISGYSGSDIEFSFVTFHGSDVWAGGKHAVVLHSSDSGSTWEHIHLGDGAAGSVSSISAIGPDIRVTTSESQTWSSQDGGKTWSQN